LASAIRAVRAEMRPPTCDVLTAVLSSIVYKVSYRESETRMRRVSKSIA